METSATLWGISSVQRRCEMRACICCNQNKLRVETMKMMMMIMMTMMKIVTVFR
jgi:hypothetical protein